MSYTLFDQDSESEGTRVPRRRMVYDGALGRRILLAPWDGRANGPGFFSTLVSLVLELFWSLVLGFAVVSARRYASLGAAANGLQVGFFVGLTHAVVFLLAWIWTIDYGLKRHLNWAITLAHLFKFTGNSKLNGTRGPDYGILAFLLYAGLQFGGAALAGVLLKGYGVASIPNTSQLAIAGLADPSEAAISIVDLTGVSTGLVWFAEFFGTMVVILALIYNDTRRQDKENDLGDSGENEYENHTRTGVIVALAIVAMTTMLYPLGSWSFGNVPYFAGLVGVGVTHSNPTETVLADWAHYLFTPFAAAAAAALLGYGLSEIVDLRSPGAWRDMGLNRRMYVSRNIATPLTQRQAPPRNSAKLRVGPFE